MSLTDLTIDEKKQLYYDLVENDNFNLSPVEQDYVKDLIIADIDAEEKRSGE
jgi:hypothetical protein